MRSSDEPAQLSVAVGAVKLVTSHCAVMFDNVVTSATGAVLSLMTTFCCCVEIFPLPSLYVQVIVVLEVIGSVALCVPVIEPAQLSVAVGAVKLVTSHCAVMFDNVVKSATGAVMSIPVITIFCCCVVTFPFPSLYVQVIVVLEVIGSVALCIPVIEPAQLSVAVGAVKLVTSHCAVMFDNVVTSATGAVLSLMTTFCCCVEIFPLPSSYDHVIVVLEVIGSVALCVPVIEPAQLSVAVGAVKLVTSHCAVMFDNVVTSATGDKSSTIVKFNVIIESQPDEFVAIKVAELFELVYVILSIQVNAPQPWKSNPATA